MKEGNTRGGGAWTAGSLTRIVSGGQTGADRGGLDAAIALGVAHGGWSPKGRRAEDGAIPPQYLLREAPDRGYRDRTRRNVVDSDATIVLTKGRLTPGSRQTMEMAREAGRPALHVDVSRWPGARGDDIARFREWLEENRIGVLNVAGSRESKAPGLQAKVKAFLVEALAPAMDEGMPLAAEPQARWETGTSGGGEEHDDGDDQ